MIGLEDRQSLALGIHIAHESGARLHLACEIAGIDLRTLQRWKASDGLVAGDRRSLAVRATPAHALSPAERIAVLSAANEPRFADVPPLADEGIYLASESASACAARRQRRNAQGRDGAGHAELAGCQAVVL